MDPEHPPFDDFDDDLTVAFNPANAKQQRPPADDFDDDATVAASTPVREPEPEAAPLRPRTVRPSPTEPAIHAAVPSEHRQSLRDRLPEQRGSSTWRSDEVTTAGSLRPPPNANRRRLLAVIAVVVALAIGIGAYVVLTGGDDADAEQESSHAALA